MTTIVLRHGDASNDGNLSDHGIDQSKIKGSEVRTLIGDVATDQIRIVSSTAPRATQTAMHIASELGVEGGKVQRLEELWDDNTHPGNAHKCLEFLRQLPPHLALIVITHLDIAYPIAKGLGYEGEEERLPSLGMYVLGDSEQDIQVDGEQDMVFPEGIEGPLTISTEVPLGDKRAISIVGSSSELQAEGGQIIRISTKDRGNVVFLAPNVMPIGPEEAMTGQYDSSGLFPIEITTIGEEHAFRFCEESLEKGDTYIDQLEGVKLYFQLNDPSINVDNWDIMKGIER